MDANEQKFITEYLSESVEILQAFAQSETMQKTLVELTDVIVGSFKAGNKIMLAGNGGSAADAQHIAGEFISRLFFDHAPLAAVALTTDSSVLTAVGNDYGYEKVFERQVLGLGRSGDVFVAISTSGKSPNILRALKAARSIGVVTVGFTGAGGGAMREFCDHLLCAPCTTTALIQQIHIVAAHVVCGLCEARIFKRDDSLAAE